MDAKDAQLIDELIEERVHEVLASMGGDLLSTYGARVAADIAEAGNASVVDQTMTTLGGYLLERYGGKDDA